jgi:hypothetical protein
MNFGKSSNFVHASPGERLLQRLAGEAAAGLLRDRLLCSLGRLLAELLGLFLRLTGQLLHQVRPLRRRDGSRSAERGRDQKLFALQRRDELLAAPVRDFRQFVLRRHHISFSVVLGYRAAVVRFPVQAP